MSLVTAAGHGHRPGHEILLNDLAVLIPVVSVDWGFGLVTKLVTCVGLVTRPGLVDVGLFTGRVGVVVTAAGLVTKLMTTTWRAAAWPRT